MRPGSRHIFIEFTISSVDNDISGVISWFCYQMALDTSFHLSEVASVQVGKITPISSVVRVSKCLWRLLTMPSTEDMLNLYSFFSCYNGGGMLEGWGEVTTKCQLKKCGWNPFGKVWLSLYTHFSFPVPWCPWGRPLMALGWSLVVGIDEWYCNALRAEVRATQASSSRRVSSGKPSDFS